MNLREKTNLEHMLLNSKISKAVDELESIVPDEITANTNPNEIEKIMDWKIELVKKLLDDIEESSWAFCRCLKDEMKGDS